MSNIAKMIAIAKRFGGGSGPSEVVILPETELTPASISDGVGMYYLFAPLENIPAAGAKCKLMWGGTEYTNTVVDISATMGEPTFLLGNTDLVPTEDMKFDNPDADAPYCTMFVPGGMPSGEGDQVAYGMMVSMGIIPDPPVLSIVQTEGAASGGAVDSPVVIAKLTNDNGTLAIDKTFEQIESLVKAGKIVYLQHVSDTSVTLLPLANYTGSSTPKMMVFSALCGGKMGIVVRFTPLGVESTTENY